MKRANQASAKTLRADIVECFIDDTLSRSKQLRLLTKRIIHAQRELRSVVDDEGWTAYLKLEDAVNARASKQLRLLFRRMLTLWAASALR